jgi:hypothetical protein
MLLASALVAPLTVAGPVAVLTQHNDNSRTGANLGETWLSTKNVNTNQFGLLFTRSVDDLIYAQPLVMTNVSIPGKGIHNVVYVATVNNSVFAFDADDPSVVAPYWQVSFLSPNVVPPSNTDMTGACGGAYLDFSGHMGIVSTPVIDSETGTVYLLVRTKETSGNAVEFVQRLHALDTATGAERLNSPVRIDATYPGTGDGSVGGFLSFDGQKQNQRSGLLLVNGVVYVAWASHCDWGPYHGWIMGYDARTLQQVRVYNDTPNGSNGGIWMGGQGLAADPNGNIYLTTGNGSVGIANNPRSIINRGESFLKLTPQGAIFTVSSWFTPFSWSYLESYDLDVGSGGVLLIPGTDLAFSGGKQGVLYLVKRDNMGGLSSSNSDTNVVQSMSLTGGLFGGSVWWDGPDGSYVYVWLAGNRLRQFKFDWAAGKFQVPNYAQSAAVATNGWPGGILALSADAARVGSGIVWASRHLDGSAGHTVQRGILHAFDAANVSRELWNSEMLPARDAVGLFAKFVPPTVANGKVYLATFSNRLDVYGLFPVLRLLVPAEGQALLQWPTNSGLGMVLQVSSALASRNWAKVTNQAVATNGMFELVLPASEPQSFYRLKDSQ